MATIRESQDASNSWDVIASDGCYLGRFYRTPYGLFACPHDSQIQMLACAASSDAFNTVVKLGLHHIHCTRRDANKQ